MAGPCCAPRVAGGLLLLAGCASPQPYFSADHDITSVVTGEIDSAAESVHVAIYTFTDPSIRDALVDVATVRGVEVLLCADAEQTHTVAQQAEALDALVEAGVDARVADGFRGGIMHHKFAVIDQRTVVTGSFNFTLSANQANDENLLVLTSPEVADRYEAAFQDLWSRCEAP